jgi:L-cysteine S-thiosulfotransferase
MSAWVAAFAAMTKMQFVCLIESRRLPISRQRCNARTVAYAAMSFVVTHTCALGETPEFARTARTQIEIVADTIPTPLSTAPADATRGRAIVLDRANGNCLICHQVPEPSEAFQGNLGPDLRGVGARLTPGQLRMRMVDQSRLNPATLMPPFYRVDGLVRVAPKFAGTPVLKAAEIEDVVAYLATLKD